MISIDDYLAHGLAIEQPSEAVIDNAQLLLPKVNALLERAAAAGVECALHPVLDSGWRPASYNAKVPNASRTSKHMSGEAADVRDPEGMLDDWCVRNLEVLAEIGLWLEHPGSTKGWTHVQSVAPRSGNRMFWP